MKIYDISQEVFSSKVYDGDPAPKIEKICSMDKGDTYNLTAFSMCAHNGTHIDAPAHFIKGGKTIDALDLSKFVGDAIVITFNGEVDKTSAESILDECKKKYTCETKRILFKGNAILLEDGAKVFSNNKIDLIGVESQSVGPLSSPLKTHLELLKNEVVILEGINLKSVLDGVYTLNCVPLNLKGAEGSPCRAILIEK